MAKVDSAVAGGLAKVSIWCSTHARTVLVLMLAVTAVFAYGMTKITTNVDVADVLPRGNANTEAAQRLSQDFKSTFTQQVTLQLHVDESGEDWARDNAKLTYRGLGAVGPGGATPTLPTLPTIPTLPPLPVPLPGQDGGNGPLPFQSEPDSQNITDEVYVRAMQELQQFIHERTDFTRTISVNNIYSLINWTVAGGDGSGGMPAANESAFTLPTHTTREGAIQYAVVDATVKVAILDTVDAVTSPSWNHAAILFMPPADNDLASRELGEQMLKVRDEYVAAVEAGETEFSVWGEDNKPLFTVDLPVANAHSSRLVREDVVRLMPMVGAFILVCLYVAFRNVRAIAVSFASLTLGVVWSYGTMGYMGIALNTLNMTIVPLVMGIGIDYSIHIINEFAEHKSAGHTNAEAFRIAGSRSGLAMLIATLTTIGGLAVLIWSPSLLIAELGIISTVALTSIYLLTITFIPAALSLVGGSQNIGRDFSRSRIMPALARGVTVARIGVVVLLLAGSAVAYVGTQSLHKEAFGDPGRNYLPSDPMRKEHEQGLAYFYEAPDSDEKANILTFSGPGILTDDAMRYYRTIEENLKTKPRVIDDTLRTLPFFLETWLTVKGGANGAAQQTVAEQLLARDVLPDVAGRQVDDFPEGEAQIRAEVDAMFASPMRELSSIIINHPKNDMAAMTFSVRAATYPEAEEVWHQVWDAVAAANRTFGGHAPQGVSVAFVGNTATNYLFIAEELPWLGYMNVLSNILLAVLVFVMTRSVLATLVTMAVSVLTSLWWLAVLPILGIGLAITLTLPFAFIIAIGTDYAIHFIWNIRQTGDARGVFESTGKAVFFSAVTTTGAFTFFIFLQNVAVRRTMIATTLAFAIIFAITLLVIPIFYKVQSRRARALAATLGSGGHGDLHGGVPAAAAAAAWPPETAARQGEAAKPAARDARARARPGKPARDRGGA